VWDSSTGEQIRTILLPKRTAGTAGIPVLSPDGRTLYVPFGKYQSKPINKDGKRGFYYYDVDGEITVWDVASGRQLPSLKQSPPHAVISVKVSPDGSALLALDFVADDSGIGWKEKLTRWDLRTGEHHSLLDGRWHALFAPGGKSFAATLADVRTNQSKVVLRDSAKGKERLVVAETNKGLVSATAFSPDGRYLTGLLDPSGTNDPPEVKLWDVASGKEVGSFSAPQGTSTFRRPGFIFFAFTAPVFSADGCWLAVCLHTGRVYLYDVAGRKLAWSQDVKNGFLREAAFSPDGRWLAVAAQDSPEDLQPREEVSPFDLPQPRIFLFDLKAGGQFEEIVAPHGIVGRLAFGPDSKTIAMSGTGCVWIFDVSRPPHPK
jgi:WD40 repeat protein